MAIKAERDGDRGAEDVGRMSSRRRAGLVRYWAGLPWWVRVLLGLGCAVLGATLVLRPFASLGTLAWLIAAAMAATGVADLAAARGVPAARLRAGTGVAWLVGSVVVAAWAGLTLRALAVLVGVFLIAAGVGRAAAGMRGSADVRSAAILLGVAEIVSGVLALAWPDLTLLVVAVVFGARTVMLGLSLAVDAWRGRAHPGTSAQPQTARAQADAGRDRGGLRRWRVWPRVIAAAAALVVALALAGVSVRIHDTEPVVDAFYIPARSVPDSPGQLLRAEAYSTAVPSGALAWRILYTTTRDDTGTPAVASAIVMRSRTVPAGPRPVIAWAHGTTGFAQNCAPSILHTGLGSGLLPAAEQIVANGWVLVATDYVGLGTAGPHPYLIGQGEARSVLDAVRAARHFDQVHLSPQTVVWGHSQGGGAALWTGGLQAEYAPDVPLTGVAALAPASDLPGLVNNLATVPGGSLFASYIVASYTHIYPDVHERDYLRPAAQTFVEEIAKRCLSGPQALVSVATSLTFDRPIFSTEPTSGAFGRRLAQNTPTKPIPAPLLIAQGATDTLVLPARQAAYAHRLCNAGQKLEYRLVPGRDHVGVVAADSPLIPYLLNWTTDRLNGKPAPSACP